MKKQLLKVGGVLLLLGVYFADFQNAAYSDDQKPGGQTPGTVANIENAEHSAEAIDLKVTVDPQNLKVVHITHILIDDAKSARAAENYLNQEVKKLTDDGSRPVDLNLITYENPQYTPPPEQAPYPENRDLLDQIRTAYSDVKEVKAALGPTWVDKLNPVIAKGYYMSLTVMRVFVNATLATVGVAQTYGISYEQAFPVALFVGGVTGILQLGNKYYGRWINYDGLFGLAADPNLNPDKAQQEKRALEQKQFIGQVVYEGKKLIKEFGLFQAVMHGYFASLSYVGVAPEYNLLALSKAVLISMAAETGAMLYLFKRTQKDLHDAPFRSRLYHMRSATWAALFSIAITTPQVLSSAGGNIVADVAIIGIGAAGWVLYSMSFLKPKEILGKITAKFSAATSVVVKMCESTFF